ncbi:ribonuclease 2 [Spinacia oleracea]|uniref:Ribonuclease 2 n=1 Tax=Spinacia oleracea TaxID=3562 RepID=A0A9R0JFD4_SPIOL|nr:ribonuclease 2 [Spinacia oleracea]
MTMALSISIFALLLITFTVAVASTADVDSSLLLSSNQREFDYFQLALQWPGTYCRTTHKCCQKNGCCRNSGAPQHFTIHGLWPDYNDGTWPSCCTKSNFDEKEISTLRKDLDEYWPSLSCGSPSSCHGHKGSFWGHEWEKHGTCSSPVVKDEYNYFRTGLTVYFKYNITEALSDAGYVPSNSEKYPLGGIISAIENAFHISPTVVCSGDAVKELNLCFYKDFKPRDCATRSRMDNSKTSCPKFVSLPTYDSSRLGIVGALESFVI